MALYWLLQNDMPTPFECRYFLALHHPGSSKLILQPTPVYLVSRQVKALKNFKPTEPGISERIQARNMLGEAFGTKKAKAAISAHERNKVDVCAMEFIANVLQDRIDEGTENLPTRGVSTFLVTKKKAHSQRGQRKWRTQQTLHVSSQLTMQMPRDQKTSIRCITSFQNRNGLP
jgi:A49-like RNA polymerase I associated factor